ncbi:MAG: nitrate ABC transporter, permease protein, partial [Glaciimonas sp.]|nr:nitrate ABC transporter, permease protein [Glaciimonas sp.]
MTKPRTQNNNLRMKKIIAPILGLLGLIMVWQLIAMNTQGGQFPTPLLTLQEAIKLFTDPFYRNSPNDQGIGWNILASLQR